MTLRVGGRWGLMAHDFAQEPAVGKRDGAVVGVQQRLRGGDGPQRASLAVHLDGIARPDHTTHVEARDYVAGNCPRAQSERHAERQCDSAERTRGNHADDLGINLQLRQRR